MHSHLSGINKVIKGTTLPNAKIVECAQALIAQQVKATIKLLFFKV